jgi:hypothetical protein
MAEIDQFLEEEGMTESIKQIAKLMTEQLPMPGMTSHLSGGTASQDAMGMMPGDQELGGMDEPPCDEPEATPFSQEQFQAARDLIAMTGSADRARELIDKIDDAVEVLDDSGAEEQAIDMVADLIPQTPDAPMGRGVLSIQSMFNPSSGQ